MDNKRKMEVVVEMPQVKPEAITDAYLKQAAEFLTRFQLEILIAFKNDTRCPPWSPDVPGLQSCRRCGSVHGDHYRVTVRRKGTAVSRIDAAREAGQRKLHAVTFDFWGSLHDRENHRRISNYDVLATVASDASCPTDATEVISEFGLNPDSISDYRRALAAARFAQRLQRFFTPEEITALGEIN
jgi:hypothetical protein